MQNAEDGDEARLRPPGSGTDPELEAPATFWGESGSGERELKLAFDAG